MKTALILYGVKPLECVEKNNITCHNVLDYTINHWKEYILNINKNIDVFVHSWSLDYENIVIENYHPKKYIFEKQKSFKNVNNTNYLNQKTIYNNMNNEEIIRSKYYSMCKAINLLNEYEIEQNIKYDIILISRMDLLWFNKVELNKINPNYFYTSNWNYAYDKHKGRNLMYNNKLLPLDHFFITNSIDIKIFGNLFNEIDNYIHHENPHAIILEFLYDKEIWKKHKTIFHTFYDHLLLRTLFNDCENQTGEWKNYDPKKQREKLIQNK